MRSAVIDITVDTARAARASKIVRQANQTEISRAAAQTRPGLLCMSQLQSVPERAHAKHTYGYVMVCHAAGDEYDGQLD